MANDKGEGMEALIRKSSLSDIYEKVLAEERLSFEDGVRLYKSKDLTAVGYLANIVRERKNGNKAYFVRNQHINYTNICNKFCRFCSFYTLPNNPRAYTLSVEDIRKRVMQYIDYPITEIHMVAGINPKLSYEYYLDILRAIKEVRPEVHIKAYTMIELVQISKVAKKPIKEVLVELMEAGLDALPGGGSEVFSQRVHAEIFRYKSNADEWLSIAKTAHHLGLKSNATMLYGHIETAEEKVSHLLRLRELQDETGGFLTFIPLSFHPENSDLSYLPSPTGCQDLRELAVARLMLDNFPHIKSFWVMITPPVSQASLWYGADDIDGTIIEYEITRDPKTDTRQHLSREQLLEMIVEAGRDPVERDPLYNVVSLCGG